MADTDRIKRNLSKMVDQGAPEADLAAYLKSEGFNSADEWRAALAPKKSLLDRAGTYARGLLDEATQGLTLGFGDELGAAVDATIPTQFMYPTSQADSWRQRYDENLANERGRMQGFRENNPVAATAAGIGGNLVGALNLAQAPAVGGLFTGSASLGANVAKGAIGGAALGGAQGFGEGEGGFGARAANAIMPAGIGAAAGAAIPVVGRGIGMAYEKVAPKLLTAIANKADDVAPKVAPGNLSAAAPDGSVVTQDSAAASIADNSRAAAKKIEDDAAIKRLARAVANPEGVKRVKGRLDELGEGAFIADASKGTERLANVGYMTSDEAADKYMQAYRQRNSQTGKRFLGALGDNAKVPTLREAEDFMKPYITTKGAEIYGPVLRGAELNVSPEMQELRKVPLIADAFDTVAGFYAQAGRKPTEAELAHGVKQALYANAQAMERSGKPVNRALVAEIDGLWRKALHDANPAIKAADDAYGPIASMPDWLKRGGDFMKSGSGEAAVDVSPSALAADLPGATPEQLLSFKVGSSNVMRDAAMSGPDSTRRLAKSIADNEILQQKLTEIYGPEVTDALLKRARAEIAMKASEGRVIAGSPTAERAVALGNETGINVPPRGGDVVAVWDWLKDTAGKLDSPNAQVRSRLADLLANPDAAANAETLSLVEALLKRQALSRPVATGAAGATGGEFAR